MIRFDRTKLRLSFDGHGINLTDGYAERFATIGISHLTRERADASKRIAEMMRDAPAMLNVLADLIETFAPNVDQTLRTAGVQDCTPAVARALALLEDHGLLNIYKQG